MAFDYINEAFKRLDLLEEQMFNTSLDGINKLSDFLDTDDTDDVVRVIDPEAETDEDIQDSYVGKVIINCNVCHSHVFEDKEDIKIDEDGSVNIETPCPYCGEEEGFTIVGEIVPYAEPEVAVDGVDMSTDGDSDQIDSDVESENFNDDSSEATNKNVVEAFKPQKGETVIDSNNKETLVKNMNGYQVFSNNDVFVGTIDAKDDKTAVDKWKLRKFEESYDSDSVDEALGIGAGLALGGAAIGAGMIGSKLVDSYEPENEKDRNISPRMSRATRRLQRDDTTLSEDFKEVSIKTEDQKLEMTSDENGKVTVTTEPIAADSSSGDMIVPVSDETESEILDNNAEVTGEQPAEENELGTDTGSEESADSEESLDLDFDEMDEEGMDELGESYLCKVYENVKSFKTTGCSANDHALIVEGIITFNSGAQKKTGFLFEAQDVNSRGQLRFRGNNKHFAESMDAFSLIGRVDNRKLFVESLKYNYKVNEESVRGLVRRK